MSIDERLEALTMNLELTARDVSDLQKAVSEMRVETQKALSEMRGAIVDMKDETDRFQKATDDRFAKWQVEKQHLDEKVDSLMDGIRMLLAASQAHQNRIERLESKSF